MNYIIPIANPVRMVERADKVLRDGSRGNPGCEFQPCAGQAEIDRVLFFARRA